ncbi:c-type cytochrome domain-containing protein [Roseivivax sp. CAU 1761]
MCHSAHGASGGLRLDTFQHLLNGSSNGPVVVWGDPDGSELVRRITGRSLPRMPFLGPQLPAEEVELILSWVDSEPTRTEVQETSGD